MREFFYQLYKSFRELEDIKITDSTYDSTKEFIESSLRACKHLDLFEPKYLERYMKEKEIK